jgi:NADPH2:quinone reductase
MQAIAARLYEHGTPLRVEAVELAEPDEHEIVVQMVWGSVNPVDRYAALGHAAADGPLPRTLGTEGAGTTLTGERVLVHGSGVGTRRDGLWATAALVPAASVTEVPDDVDLEQAATIGVAGATAWRVVSEFAEVASEDRVLVLGASGGVGSMIVSLAASAGATVWGQTGNESNREWLEELGADEVIVCGAEELESRAADLSPTVVFDPLGDGFTGSAIKVIAEHGRLVVFGASAGATGEIPLLLLYRKGITVYGYAGLISTEQALKEGKKQALAAVADGTMEVSIGATFPLAQINEALERIPQRSVRGKVLIDLRR